MKWFLSLKPTLRAILVTVCAVLFFLFLHTLVSNQSLFHNLFSTKKIFVGSFDLNENGEERVYNKKEEEAKYSASLEQKVNTKKKNVRSTSRKEETTILPVVHTTQLVHATNTSVVVPEIYIQEIRAGDEKSAKNEFVKICNYGADQLVLKDFSLKKKSSTGREEGFVTTQWSDLTLGGNDCLFVANSDAALSFVPHVRWAKSHALAEKNNTLILYYKERIIDEVFWDVIPKGKSIVRDSATSSWHIKN